MSSGSSSRKKRLHRHPLDLGVKKVLHETRMEAERIVRKSGKQLDRKVSKTSSWRDKLSPGYSNQKSRNTSNGNKASRRISSPLRRTVTSRSPPSSYASRRTSPRSTTKNKEHVHVSRQGDIDVDIQTSRGKEHVHVDGRTGEMDIDFRRNSSSSNNNNNSELKSERETRKFVETEIEKIEEEKALLRDRLMLTERSQRDADHKVEYWKTQLDEKFKRERDLEVELAKAVEVANSLRKQSKQEQEIFQEEILKSRKRMEELEIRVLDTSNVLDSKEIRIRELERKLQEMTGELSSTHTRLRAQIMRNEERERWFQVQLSESNDTIERLGFNLKESKILIQDSETNMENLRRSLEDANRDRLDAISERDAALFEIQNTREREKIMASQLTDSETSFGKMNMDLRDARRNEKALRDELATLKTDLDRKSSELLDANAKRRDAEAKAIEWEENALGCERREVLMKQKVEMLRKRLRLRDEAETRDRGELEDSRDIVNQRDLRIVELERELEASKNRVREMFNRVSTYENQVKQTTTRLRVTEKLNEELRSRVQRDDLADESKRLSRFRASALSDVGMKRSRVLSSPSSSSYRSSPYISNSSLSTRRLIKDVSRSPLIRTARTSSSSLVDEDTRLKRFQMELDLEEEKIRNSVAKKFRDGDAMRMIKTKHSPYSSPLPTPGIVPRMKEKIHVTPQGDVDVDMMSKRGLHEHVHVDSKTGAVDIDVGKTHLHINGSGELLS